MGSNEFFSEEELVYYSRQIVLKELGLQGQARLKDAHVCVAGLGGLGSPVSTQLASMGVGHLRIVDRDVVEMSNLQRQHLYGVDSVGYPKVEAAATRLERMNPYIAIEPMPLSITPGNAEKIISGMDLVVDCLDSMAPRYALNRACVKLGIPMIFGAVISNVGNATTIIPGETACLECFQGNVDDEALPSCAVAGVHPSVIGILASIQVSEVVRVLTGRPPNLADSLIFCDLEDLSFEKIKLAKVDNCPVCGTSPKSEPSPIRHEPVQEICGREGRRVYVFSPDDDMGLGLWALNGRLAALGYSIDVEARMGTTFSRGDVRGSVLSSGVTILEGVGDMEEAVRLHGVIHAE
ncbi:MAG: HesA/MoeB/ThiF family protein [Candidatus Bathyarchaeota archaeon]|nr:MAG: HesA/MoeB/ThiF family protein [Candidatus Bathyarchaeota archaeon]